ncbi:MAG: FecR domain-containing protein [Rhodocyclaceae bacterium]|nr:FecR domain-containing protein [Rhodocyclaceae bacterium]
MKAPRQTAILLAAALVAVPPAATAQEVGEVVFVQGIANAQKPGQEARFLGKGDLIGQGEVLSTGGRGFAVIGLRDGTRMTLRPNTSFAVDDLSLEAGRESLVMRLVKGGLRAITGVIGKRNPNGVRLDSVTATIGIRGTEFDARLCGEECAKEDRYPRSRAPVATTGEPLVARVAQLGGTATAVGRDGQSRTLLEGGPVYNGESVRTAPGAYAVLAFRDQSKVTLTADTDFKLEDVRFSGAQAEQGNFVVRLFRGGLRAVTGLVGRRNPGAVSINTVVATIGIRGTGVDVRVAGHCASGGGGAAPAPAAKGRRGKGGAAGQGGAAGGGGQACASDAAFAYVWDGAVSLSGGGKEVLVEKERAAVFNPRTAGPAALAAVPAFFLEDASPRPDRVPVDFSRLFGAVRMDDHPAGLYVGVRSGAVRLTAGGESIDLGAFEAAHLGAGGVPARIEPLPGFLFNDPYPTPDELNPRTLRLIELLSPGGQPGEGICEIRP